MLRLRDIMTADVESVSPDTTLREAMELLARRHLSGAPVVRAGNVLGIVTATDLMMFVSSLAGVPTERLADDSWGEWNEPSAVSGGEPQGSSGLFSELWDDAGSDVTARIASDRGGERNVLEEHDVSEVMTRTPLAMLPPDADVAAAAAMMCERRIHRVLVVEGGKLVGIVSTLDVTRAAAEHRFTARTYLFNRDEAFGGGD